MFAYNPHRYFILLLLLLVTKTKNQSVYRKFLHLKYFTMCYEDYLLWISVYV